MPAAPVSSFDREQREEAGLEADELEPLLSILPTPELYNEELFLYRTRHLTAAETTPSADEQIEVHWNPLEEALKMAADGRIHAAKTIAAFFRQHTPAVDMRRPLPFRGLPQTRFRR